MRILIVDDDDDIRILLSRMLNKWGHEVITASNGVDAWKFLQNGIINFVISDWMMPKMNGIELCKRIRHANFDRYIYVILLTAREEKQDLIKGMESGADDFVVKPFNKGELNVRIRAGERILKLERDLEKRNNKLSEAYSIISKDLEMAAKMQKSLLPDASLTISEFVFNWMFCPCSFVAGDIFNFFNLDEDHICFYMLDVAGHGVSAAMLSITLSKILTPSHQMVQPLKYFVHVPPHYEITPPAMVMQELNKRFQNENDAMQYFTMIYGVIDARNDKIRMTQAGHPSPIYVQRGAKATFIGTGGYPIGMISDVDYDEQVIDFKAGDRLFIYSDGVTECTNANKEQFSEEYLVEILEEWKNLPLKELLSRLEQRLINWKGSRDYEDDVSLLAIERV